MRVKTIFTGLIILFALSAVGQITDAPVLNCVSIEGSGKRTLTWSIPADPSSDFVAYYLYEKTALGSAKTTISSYSKSIYTFSAIPAEQGSYWMEVEDNLGNIISSDTLSPLWIDFTMDADSAVHLFWSETVSASSQNASFPYYYIYRSSPIGTPFIRLDSVATKFYKDTIPGCNSAIYFVVLNDSNSCFSNSETQYVDFYDNDAPLVIDIDSVSVNGANNAIVGWFGSVDKDVQDYIVYQNIGGNWQILDTLRNATSYVNNNSSADLGFERYKIAAMDTCGNVGPLGSEQQTIFMTLQGDACAGTATINWTAYLNWQNGVGGYRIMRSLNGGLYQEIANTTALNYVDNSLQSDSNYCYKIQAVDGNALKTSSSNFTCINIHLPIDPEYVIMESVGVNINTNKIDVSVILDQEPDISNYWLQRSFDANGPYSTLSAITPNGPTSVIYSDVSLSSVAQKAYYRVVAENFCGVSVIISDTSSQIIMQVNGQSGVNTINWTAYQNWDNGVVDYELFRVIGGAYTSLATVSASTLQYQDNAMALVAQGQPICYQIKATSASPANRFNTQPESWSNAICVESAPTFYIANAFTPNGLNPIFGPVMNNYIPTEFEMQIYSRFGDMLFRSFDATIGWDGKNRKGNDVPTGVYVYFLTFEDKEGQFQLLRGSVTLLR
ncbi:MAG: gliding motility-associated-like protein [Flavobacteriales bacterium]|jgi:gliding motility-associated-like protein